MVNVTPRLDWMNNASIKSCFFEPTSMGSAASASTIGALSELGTRIVKSQKNRFMLETPVNV